MRHSRKRYAMGMFIQSFLLMFSIGFIGDFSSGSLAASLPHETITLGALLDLSGDLSSAGQAAKAILQTAIEDFNTRFDETNPDRVPFRADVVVLDTQQSPQVALQRLEFLANVGVKVVLGPQSSAELEAIQDFADANNIMIISFSSTSPSLAIDNDNIYRMVPDDTCQGLAMATLMLKQGVKSLAALHIDNVYGNDLFQVVKSELEEAGDTVAASISYPSGTQDFQSYLTPLNDWVQTTANQTSYESIGIYVIGFDEVIPLLNQAGRFPALSKVRWYGSDSTAQSEALLADRTAADFAVSVCFTNPVFGGNITASPQFLAVQGKIQQQTGHTPSAQLLSLYDALQLAVTAYQQTNLSTDINDVKQEFVRQANHYSGITGSTVLNDAGDRLIGDYDFWNIAKDGDAYQWTRTGIFLDCWGGIPDFIYFAGCPTGSQSMIPSFILHE